MTLSWRLQRANPPCIARNSADRSTLGQNGTGHKIKKNGSRWFAFSLKGPSPRDKKNKKKKASMRSWNKFINYDAAWLQTVGVRGWANEWWCNYRVYDQTAFIRRSLIVCSFSAYYTHCNACSVELRTRRVGNNTMSCPAIHTTARHGNRLQLCKDVYQRSVRPARLTSRWSSSAGRLLCETRHQLRTNMAGVAASRPVVFAKVANSKRAPRTPW